MERWAMRPMGADRKESIITGRLRRPAIPPPPGALKTIEAIHWMASSIKAPVGVGPTHKGFADLSLPAWVRRHKKERILKCITYAARSSARGFI